MSNTERDDANIQPTQDPPQLPRNIPPQPLPPHSRRWRDRPQPKWKRQLRYFYLRFVRLRGTPRAIARGLAAGVFAGCFPLFGLQTIIGIAIAAIIRGNKIMAAAGTWVSNPLTYIPIYFFNFRVGEWLLGSMGVAAETPDLEVLQDIILDSTWQSFSDLLALGANFTITLFLGCFVIGIISAIASYFLGLWLLQHLPHRKRS